MSKTIKCDCCGRTSPEVDCLYQRRKKFQFFEVQDGYFQRIIKGWIYAKNVGT